MTSSADLAAPSAPRPIPRWRWWVYLFVVGCYPVALALSNLIRAPHTKSGAKVQVALPASVKGLLIVGAIELASILLFFGIAWLFARPGKDQLFFRWRGGFGPVWRGALYSIGLRLLPVAALIVIGIALNLIGISPKTISDWMKSHQPQTGGLADSMRAGNSLYRLIMLTFFSFAVAGLREELWRAATLRGLLEVAPRAWSQNAKNGAAVLISALIFGIGHLYQGIAGVILTALIGLALGAATLHHRSFWPSVIAHGFFDATSFLLVIVGVDKLAG